MNNPRTVVVGAGRAGGSFGAALTGSGWDVTTVHHDELSDDHPALSQADLVLLCVPDVAVGPTAAMLAGDSDRVVAHCAGSLGLEALGVHPRRAAIHPLVSLPDPETGAARLRGAWFAVSGDDMGREVVDALQGRVVAVDDSHRAAYHAAAVVASNHLVALLGQVERIAGAAGVPLEAYSDLVAGTLANVFEVGPEAALTGPVSRGDWETVRRHMDVLDPQDRDAYLAMAAATAALAGRELPTFGDG